MHRIYCPKEYILTDKVSISDPDQAHYLNAVLRVRNNESLTIFDGEGREYLCEVVNISARSVSLDITEKTTVKKPDVEFTIACAIPKKSKMDDIIDKLSQLGARRVIPMFTERVNVDWGEQQKEKHLLRWRKIAISAAEQSGRAYLAEISPVQDIKDVLEHCAGYSLKLIPTLPGRKVSLKEALTGQEYKSILVLIGPEGDFTPQEVALAMQSGFVAVSLGDLVLRVETAALAVASYIRLHNQTR